MKEPTGRAERVVRWSLLDPIGWFLLQLTLLLFAGGIVWVVDRVIGDLSPGAQWGVFAAVLLLLAALTYWIRRRYLAEQDRAGDRELEAR